MLIRRAVLGPCAAGLAAAFGSRFAQAQPAVGAGERGRGMPGMASRAMTPKECVESCVRTHAMCLETARYCTEAGAPHAAPAHLALLLDCAEMCQMTANSLLRRSPQHAVVCGACARLCEACARDCDAVAGGDERMRRCAATCRECARDCPETENMPL